MILFPHDPVTIFDDDDDDIGCLWNGLGVINIVDDSDDKIFEFCFPFWSLDGDKSIIILGGKIWIKLMNNGKN